MIYCWLILLVILNTLSLGLVFLGLPGNWMIVTFTCLFAWWRSGDNIFSVYTLIAITILAVGGELIEFFAGAGGAKKAGTGWFGAIGAIIGTIPGAVIGTFVIPVPLFGTVLGACFGAGIGAWGFELMAGKKTDRSVRSGIGAGVGVLIGTTTKFILGCIIWLIVLVAAFW